MDADAEQRDAQQGCGAQVLPASGIRSTDAEIRRGHAHTHACIWDAEHDAEIRRGVDAACAASADNT